MNVRWAPAVDVFTQHESERAHGLVPQREVSERAWEYFLADVSRPSIERIVRDPAIEDTHFINRATFRINGNGKRGPYPAKWHGPAVRALIVLFRLLMLAGGLILKSASWWHHAGGFVLLAGAIAVLSASLPRRVP